MLDDEITVRGPYGKSFPGGDRTEGKESSLHRRRYRSGSASFRDQLCAATTERIMARWIFYTVPVPQDDLVELKEIQDVWHESPGVSMYI